MNKPLLSIIAVCGPALAVMTRDVGGYAYALKSDPTAKFDLKLHAWSWAAALLAGVCGAAGLQVA